MAELKIISMDEVQSKEVNWSGIRIYHTERLQSFRVNPAREKQL